MFTFVKEIFPFLQDRIPKFIYAIIIFIVVAIEASVYFNVTLPNIDNVHKLDHPLIHDYELEKKIQHLRIRNKADWAAIHLFHDDKGSLNINVNELEKYKFTRVIESHNDILHSKKKKLTNVPVIQYFTIIKNTDEEGIFYIKDIKDLNQNLYTKNLLKSYLNIISIVIIPLYDPLKESTFVGFIMLEYLTATNLTQEELYLIEKDCEYLENTFTTSN